MSSIAATSPFVENTFADVADVKENKLEDSQAVDHFESEIIGRIEQFIEKYKHLCYWERSVFSLCRSSETALLTFQVPEEFRKSKNTDLDRFDLDFTIRMGTEFYNTGLETTHEEYQTLTGDIPDCVYDPENLGHSTGIVTNYFHLRTWSRYPFKGGKPAEKIKKIENLLLEKNREILDRNTYWQKVALSAGSAFTSVLFMNYFGA